VDVNRTISIIDNFLDSNPEPTEGDEQRKVKPTPADAAVDYVAYLMKTESDEEQKEAEQTPQLKGQSLIDDFLNKDGAKIQLQEQPTYKPEIETPAETPAEGEESYFTETLAKIYIKQGRYSKALEIIQRLNLNYPKKNAYFADQIRFLKKLIANEKVVKQ
jgi:predicted Zn-dependent protease